ncbi:hypothetical protein KUTeg_020117 [Tegillarca granosa]|uniref:CXXC-type zinc finger protein 1 n=1 Tax=Tegillarca granosa TaxID=220873 RepID=A0ABQ9E7J7_TEGGR|nr:hypothetical protein KUTeg_020117 [Tegillarca granosa]
MACNQDEGDGDRYRKSKEKTSSERKRKHIEADEPIEVEEEQPRQCYGPGCISAARNNSKYCSDECGMKLAKNRIYELLPPKIQQWQSSPCVTEENNKKMLEKIRRQQLEARQKLGELDIRQQELDALIERAKHATVSHDQDATDEYDDTELYCVTCGVEVNQKAALKHMEKCFAKYEAQTSFGSIYKTRIEGNSMFCDYYNSQQKTYCKRLKVLCPEHTKEPKVGPDEVCGCPLVSNVFEESGEYCRASKRKCNKHYCWEKLRRAEIDMERCFYLRISHHVFKIIVNTQHCKFDWYQPKVYLKVFFHTCINHSEDTPTKILLDDIYKSMLNQEVEYLDFPHPLGRVYDLELQ